MREAIWSESNAGDAITLVFPILFPLDVVRLALRAGSWHHFGDRAHFRAGAEQRARAAAARQPLPTEMNAIDQRRSMIRILAFP